MMALYDLCQCTGVFAGVFSAGLVWLWCQGTGVFAGAMGIGLVGAVRHGALSNKPGTFNEGVFSVRLVRLG